jgi:hypothetical protein
MGSRRLHGYADFKEFDYSPHRNIGHIVPADYVDFYEVPLSFLPQGRSFKEFDHHIGTEVT